MLAAIIKRHSRAPAGLALLSVVYFCLTTVCGQTLSIHTLAGNGTVGATNGFGSNARFSHLEGITADGLGNTYVADTENSTIRKITFNGFANTLAGAPGSYGASDGDLASARFYGPQALAVDNFGQVFVADTANNTIRRITADGAVSTLAGAAGTTNSLDGTGANASFNHPEALALDAGGNLYIADTWNHTIRKLSPASVVTTFAGLAGNFGATDGANSKARFNRPGGVAVDSATNIYVADTFNYTIRKITPSGNVTTIAGLAGLWGSADGTNSSARFYLPKGIAVASDNTIYVSDSGNQTIRKLVPTGTNWVVSTVAGLNGLAGSINGSGSNAQFFFPAGIALDSAGYLYVADNGNNMARTTRLVRPTLQFAQAGGALILSWPVSSEEFALWQSPAVGPLATWSLATNGIVRAGDNFVRTNAVSGTAFYRLRSL